MRDGGKKNLFFLPSRPLFVLIVVQEQPPPRNISSYTLEELIRQTEEYADTRPRRQSNEGIYIAANVTEEQLERGIQLGDGMEYGGFMNYPLDPKAMYNVGLRSTVAGSETAVYTVGNMTFSESPKINNTLVIISGCFPKCITLTCLPPPPHPPLPHTHTHTH